MYINGTGVGYNGETITKLGIGEYVTFENCTFTATNGERISTSGNDACIQFFGPVIVVNWRFGYRYRLAGAVHGPVRFGQCNL